MRNRAGSESHQQAIKRHLRTLKLCSSRPFVCWSAVLFPTCFGPCSAIIPSYFYIEVVYKPTTVQLVILFLSSLMCCMEEQIS